MAVTHVDTQSNQNGTGSTGIVVTKPTGIANDDVLIAYAVAKNTATTITLPSGFTQLLAGGGVSGEISAKIGYKVVTNAAGEGASYSFGFSSSVKGAAAVTAYRGINPAAPFAIQQLIDRGATSAPSFANLEHPYRPHAMAFLVLGGGSGSATFTSSDTTNNPIVERLDTTSSGGGSGTSKVHLAQADALVNGRELLSGGIIYAYGTWYQTSLTYSNGVMTATIVLNDTASSAVGAATTFDVSTSLSEIRTSPLQWTDGFETARTSVAGGGESMLISNPDAAFEILNNPGQFIGIYSEWDYVPEFIERRQAGKALLFEKVDNEYQKWTENSATHQWQDQYYGADANDIIRFDDNTFAVYHGYGHAGAYDGDGGSTGDSSYWTSPDGTYTKLLRVSGSAISTVASASWPGNTSYIGTLAKGGDTTIIVSNSNSNLSPPQYGASVWAFNGTSWVTGSRYNYADDGRLCSYQVQVSHVPDSKIVFFYTDSTAAATVARVGNLSDDVNGNPTVIIYGTAYPVPNTTTSSTYTLNTKPIALNATEGVILVKQNNDTLGLFLIKYTIDGSDAITFDTPIEVSRDIVTLHQKQGYCDMLLRDNRLIVVYMHYKNTSPQLTPRLSTFIYDGSSFTLEGTEDIFPASATAQVANPTLSAGSGPYYHFNYFNFTIGSRLPQLKTFSVPTFDIETNTTDDLGAYISIADPIPIIHDEPAVCFINTEGVYTSQPAFIAAPASPVLGIPVLPCFMWGVGVAPSGTPAFITSNIGLEEFVGCYLQAGVLDSSTGAFVSGPEIINADPAPMFTSGLDLMSGSVSCYMDGDAPVAISTIGGIRFDKTLNQYAEFDDHLDIRPTTEFTINFWMKAYDASNGGNVAVFLEKDRSGDQSIGIYEHSLAGTSGWHYGINTGTWSAQNSTGTWIADTWYMVTLRYDGSNVYFFINGQLDGSFAKTGSLVWTTDLWRVAYRQNTGEYTNMAFAEFDIWNYALTNSEIENLFVYKINSGVGLYTFGADPNILESVLNTYISNVVTGANPYTISSSQTLDFAVPGLYTSQVCMIAGPVFTKTNHDLQIIIDGYRSARHDTIIRIGGQGDSVLKRVIGVIDYPITREAVEYLTNIYFQDMPGNIKSNQPSYIHAGFDMTSSQLAHISTAPNVEVVQWAYLHGAYNTLNSTQNMCIVNSDHTVSQLAYIPVNDSGSEMAIVYAFIVGTIDAVDIPQNFYIAGLGKETTTQSAYLLGPTYAFGSQQVDIITPQIESMDAGNQDCYIPAGAVAYETPLNTYMFGAYVLDEGQPAFVHTQPIIESEGPRCFMIAPTPAVPEDRQWAFIHGNGPTTVAQPSYIQSNRNLFVGDTNGTDGNDAFIRGYLGMESSRMAYISNVIIYPETVTQRAFILVATTTTAPAQACYLMGQELETSQSSYIVNFDALANLSASKRCFLVGAGLTATPVAMYVEGTV